MSGGSAGGHRLLRSAALAVLSTLLTAVGHVAGGGTVPDLALLVVLFPLLAGAFVTVAEHCRGVVGMIATLGAGQLALHLLMVLLHPMDHLAEPVVSPGPGMLGLHAAVTLVIAGVLRYADAAAALPTRAVPGPAVPARIARALAVTHVRRGPPVGC